MVDSELHIVRCDNGACGAEVRASATQVVRRKWGNLDVDEVWCLRCIRELDKATELALSSDDDVDMNEIGLDL